MARFFFSVGFFAIVPDVVLFARSCMLHGVWGAVLEHEKRL
jgi:hypothetical protein